MPPGQDGFRRNNRAISYLLIEGDRTFRYFARYMTPRLRYRFHRLGPELTNVVSGYVIGQAIISTIFGVFTFVVLTLPGVPLLPRDGAGVPGDVRCYLFGHGIYSWKG